MTWQRRLDIAVIIFCAWAMGFLVGGWLFQ